MQYSQLVFSLVVLALVLGFGYLALRWNFQHRYKGRDTFRVYAWKNPLVKLTAGIAVIMLGTNLLAPDPYSADVYENIEFARIRKMPVLAAEGYRELIKRFPYIPRYHYEYVAAYYEQDDWGEDGQFTVQGAPELSPILFYQQMRARDKRTGMKQMAQLGLGMAEYYETMENLAMRQFQDISDTTLPYLNLFKARIFEKKMRPDSALHYYRQEIWLPNGDVKHAVEGMASVMLRWQPENLVVIRSMVNDPNIGVYVPESMKRYLYVKEAALGPYFESVISSWAAKVTLIGMLGALMGLGVWMFFLRRVDIFKRESWWAMLGTVALGGIFAFAALPISDFIQYDTGFHPNGNFWHDLLYCIVGIGFIEEFVKIIPLLLILQFTNLVRGPLNYVIYASLGALGFAFVENLVYFDAGHVGIIHGRVLVSVLAHMFATSTVAFGLVLARYRYNRRFTLPLFFLFFLLASIFHGFYDFWLLNPGASAFYFLTYAVYVYATFQYAAYLNNCLNNSPIFRGRAVLDTGKLAEFLVIAQMSVLIFEYLALSTIYGPRVGNYALVGTMGSGTFLVFFVVVNLSYIDVVQGEWFGLRLWNFSNRADYNRAIGKRIQLKAKGPQSVLHQALPVRGEIIARIKLQKDNKYFLLELDQPIRLLGHDVPYVLLKAKEQSAVIEPGYNMEVAVVAFRDKEAISRPQARRKDFKLLDYALIP
ncbi:MAG: PrsW family intramembrane metalloprotease [Bacteroidota bacterium]